MSSKSLFHIGGRERQSFECLHLLYEILPLFWSTLADRFSKEYNFHTKSNKQKKRFHVG